LENRHNKTTGRLAVWLTAARLRTLPLAIAVIGLGNFLHAGRHEFNIFIFLLALLTATFLQVLSNFANDLGDSLHGADHSGRRGPERMVQKGVISTKEMKKAVMLMAISTCWATG
jgi:1,4-dihydroxy-2-naphthoate octaprenyltransferase